jgi:hypothetical protein
MIIVFSHIYDLSDSYGHAFITMSFIFYNVLKLFYNDLFLLSLYCCFYTTTT